MEGKTKHFFVLKRVSSCSATAKEGKNGSESIYLLLLTLHLQFYHVVSGIGHIEFE